MTFNMQEILQNIEQAKYLRTKLTKEHDSITNTINSFQRANELSTSTLFLTKLANLAKEAKELTSEILTFDEVILTLETELSAQATEAKLQNIPWTKQPSSVESTSTWMN
jgi:hypothetical protein